MTDQFVGDQNRDGLGVMGILVFRHDQRDVFSICGLSAMRSGQPSQNRLMMRFAHNLEVKFTSKWPMERRSRTFRSRLVCVGIWGEIGSGTTFLVPSNNWLGNDIQRDAEYQHFPGRDFPHLRRSEHQIAMDISCIYWESVLTRYDVCDAGHSC